MNFLELWKKFRASRIFRPFYLLLLSALAAFVLLTGNICFVAILVPALMLLLPHWLGERKLKNHLVNGVVIMLLTPILFALVFTPVYMDQPMYVLSADSSATDLSDGRVEPFRASGEANFNFTINMTSSDSQASQFRVKAKVFTFKDFTITNLTVDLTRDPTGDGVFSNGERFYGHVVLSPDPHSYYFYIEDSAGITLLYTQGTLGPFNATFTTHLVLWLYNGYFNMLYLLMGFLLVLMIYWWTQKAREVRGASAKQPRKRDEGGGEFTCTNCGGDVKEADAKCPNCGAEFTTVIEADEAAKLKK